MYLATRDGISRVAWTAGVILVLILKELWPKHVSNEIPHWSLPAICLAVVFGSALVRTFRMPMRDAVPP